MTSEKAKVTTSEKEQPAGHGPGKSIEKFDRKLRLGDASNLNKRNGESQNSHSVSPSPHHKAKHKNREIWKSRTARRGRSRFSPSLNMACHVEIERGLRKHRRTHYGESEVSSNLRHTHTHTHTHFRVPDQQKGTSENEVPGFVGAFTQTHINTRLVVPHRAADEDERNTHAPTKPREASTDIREGGSNNKQKLKGEKLVTTSEKGQPDGHGPGRSIEKFD